jgi:xanthine dehydrogenase accessory factor
MNKQLFIWKLIEESLRKNISVMLLYVLESSGSSPGRQGFVMVVNANGDMEGSIGGGIMEHKFVEMAKEKLLAVSHELLATSIRKQVHDKSVTANQSGMICSGEQTILLYPVKKEDIDTIEQIIASLEQNKNGTLNLSPAGIEFRDAVPENNFEYKFRSEDEWLYKEKTGYKNKLFIIGGGHCALALSKLMSKMDFYISVYDERPQLKTILENDAAHEKHFINNYTELNKLVPSGKNNYVVIMTFGYRTDDIAFRALLDKDLKYTGILGSQKKMEKLFAGYRKDGIAESVLQRIQTPIGLSINSHTPEEIAVSIAAAIIRVKNE